MFVRSQNRKGLTNGQTTYYIYQENGNFEICISNGIDVYDGRKGKCLILAQYSTLEKAIKVLDMLEQHINKTYSTQNSEFCPNGYYVYGCFEFPKDEEVL